MLVLGFPAGSFGTHAYLLAPGAGAGCVIVDPGQRSAGRIAALVAEHRLVPEAVLLTHGHFDHTWDVVPVARRYGVPVHIHPEDRFMLGAPAAGLPADFPPELLDGHPDEEPEDVRPLAADRGVLRIAGLTLHSVHVGGHTPGSVVLHCADDESLLLGGDALFAGALGRTDGPGGSAHRLRAGLARACAPLDDATVVLPGHGARTTLGREREVHAFLRPTRRSSPDFRM
ncbi:MBL fold metallo-hydrolase [Streptomyces sp. NPDC048604]|uniref:MBL fold metallo-hydrolase n=1 Tax=Streptomyces sp. NPDC048604 TaxID=3365578 RepID=UPI00371D7E0A